MSTVLAVAVMAIAAAVIVMILVLTARGRKRRVGSRRRASAGPGADAAAKVAAGGRKWPCPLCGELLGPGERIRSVIRLSPRHGRIMEISGCPRCLPPSSRPRRCPVCKAEVAAEEVLTAQVFDRSRESSKPHVHVLGCRRCMG